MRMCQEFGSAGAGAVYSLGFQYQRVHIVLEASKSAGAKGDVSKSLGLCTRCTRANTFPDMYVTQNLLALLGFAE